MFHAGIAPAVNKARHHLLRVACAALVGVCVAGAPRAGQARVIIQYFETDWDEIYRRLPEIAEKGYEGLWVPPPTKSPHAGGQFAGGGNVGHSHFDKFDLGEFPQRGAMNMPMPVAAATISKASA